MRELLDEVSSIRFWVAVVIVGLIVNLVAMWVKSWLDAAGGAVSKTIRDRNQARAQRRKTIVSQATANPHHYNRLAFAEMRDRLQAIAFLLAGVTLASLSLSMRIYQFQRGVASAGPSLSTAYLFPISGMALATITLFMSILAMFSAVDKRSLLEACEKESASMA